MTIKETLRRAPVIPVVVLEDAERAVPMARALVQGGLPVIEVTLRTRAALAAVHAIAADVRDAIVGVGTVLDPAQFGEAAAAGARFAVSPGLSPTLAEAARTTGLPYLPGTATATEVMAARAQGFTVLKCFPAVPAGGAAALKAFADVFPDIGFCPTGGISAETAPDFLELSNVLCVGGSWVASKDAIAAADWDGIAARARKAAGAA